LPGQQKLQQQVATGQRHVPAAMGGIFTHEQMESLLLLLVVLIRVRPWTLMGVL
jgi:hypothetical protein